MTAPHYGRRRFLAGAGVVGLAAALGLGVDDLISSPDARAPGSTDHTTTAPNTAPPTTTTTAPGRSRMVSGHFQSRRRHTEVGWTVSFPPGWRRRAPMPVALVLHGYAADHRYAFTDLRLQDVQAGLVAGARPARPLVLAAADGGDGYWHPHADGDDPQAMLMDEFLPLVGAMGVATDKVVAYGWSMGGYGALLLAETYPTVIEKVAVESPAIWPSYAASQGANPTAFDSAADWSAHDVVGHLRQLGSVAVRVACGLSDPFIPAARQLAGRLPSGDVTLAPGAHDSAFWRRWAPGQLRFLAS